MGNGVVILRAASAWTMSALTPSWPNETRDNVQLLLLDAGRDLLTRLQPAGCRLLLRRDLRPEPTSRVAAACARLPGRLRLRRRQGRLDRRRFANRGRARRPPRRKRSTARRSDLPARRRPRRGASE